VFASEGQGGARTAIRTVRGSVRISLVSVEAQHIGFALRIHSFGHFSFKICSADMSLLSLTHSLTHSDRQTLTLHWSNPDAIISIATYRL
jgi:hypothetical protein